MIAVIVAMVWLSVFLLKSLILMLVMIFPRLAKPLYYVVIIGVILHLSIINLSRKSVLFREQGDK